MATDKTNDSNITFRSKKSKKYNKIDNNSNNGNNNSNSKNNENNSNNKSSPNYKVNTRKFYIRRNSNKVDSIETGRIAIAHLLP